MLIDTKKTIGEISRQFPQTMKILAKYRIDLCCGGVHSLDFVAKKHGINLGTILRELEAAVKAGA